MQWSKGQRSAGWHLLALAALCFARAVSPKEQQPQSNLQLVPSRCPSPCSDHGTCNEDTGRCDCPKHRTGEACELPADDDLLRKRCQEQLYRDVKECTTVPQPCLNQCNRRGECIAGFCKCKPGLYGQDCSLSIDPGTGKPALLAWRNYTTRKKRPHVYVYELPPHLSSWTSTRRLDRSLHLLFQSRLLSSGARVADGDKADWYFIPVRARMLYDSHFLLEAVEYVRRTYPWWDRGGRHFVIHTGDLGVQESTAHAQVGANLTWLTHWGLTEDRDDRTRWRAAHRLGQDIVIPVFIAWGHFKKYGMEASPLHPLYPDKPNRTIDFYFAGRLCGDRKPPRDPKTTPWPHCQSPVNEVYSAGTRQKVHYHHAHTPGFKVVQYDPNYGNSLLTSKFCFAPLGGGHGQRQVLVSFMGCVPVLLNDNVLQPFEPELDWRQFSLQPAEADIPRLDKIVRAVSPKRLAAMQAALRCAAEHFAYSSLTGAFMGETGKYDAFETTLEILRMRKLYPDTPPQDYVKVDDDFRRFIYCGAETLGGPAPPPPPAAHAEAPDGGSNSQPAAQADPGPDGGSDLAVADVLGTGAVPHRKRRVRPHFRLHPGLCTHSKLEGRETCIECLRGSAPAHGLSGGAACCGLSHNIAACPRMWD